MSELAAFSALNKFLCTSLDWFIEPHLRDSLGWVRGSTCCELYRPRCCISLVDAFSIHDNRMHDCSVFYYTNSQSSMRLFCWTLNRCAVMLSSICCCMYCTYWALQVRCLTVKFLQVTCLIVWFKIESLTISVLLQHALYYYHATFAFTSKWTFTV